MCAVSYKSTPRKPQKEEMFKQAFKEWCEKNVETCSVTTVIALDKYLPEKKNAPLFNNDMYYM